MSTSEKLCEEKRLLITLNEPEKGSLPQIFGIPTGKLMNMLSAMPKTSE